MAKNTRGARTNTQIRIAENAAPYPKGRENIEDRPASDEGGNFGRIARTGIMDDFVRDCSLIKLCGIEIRKWQDFFKESTPPE